MDRINQSDLLKLAESTGDNLISLYMPTHIGREARQDRIRFKNLLNAAEEQLVKLGVRSSDARQQLASASEKLENSNAWEEQGTSLAAFIGPKEVRVWRLAMECDERSVVGNVYHVVPLVYWLSNDAPYYVLAVSQNEVRLYYGRRGGLEEVEVPHLPASREDALQLDEPETHQQQHAAARGTPGKQGLVFHGQGGAPDDSKQEILAYFREIDRALSDTLQEQTEPLVFAGVDYLFPIYQEANRYAHLHPVPVTGNPKLWSPDELKQRAWSLVEEEIKNERQAALKAFGNSISAGQAIDRVDDVLLAAQAGAVDTLFIDPKAHVVGTFDTEALNVDTTVAPGEVCEDLLNLATILTLRGSGRVEPLEAGDLPGGGPMAAVLRYPLPSKSKATTTASRG